MLPPDNHVHTEWSWDAHHGSMRESCRKAVELGLPAIAFTEHVDFKRWGQGDGRPGVHVPRTHRAGSEPLDVEGYMASIERCREEFPEVRVVAGMEAGEPHLFPGSLERTLRAGSFDRVLGSLHAIVEDGLLVAADYPRREEPEDLMRRYLAELLNLVETSEAFEVLAHADFPRRNWPSNVAFEEKAFEEEYRAVFRALATGGRVLELNTRSPMWSSTLIGWWIEEGGRALSFGSDAHVPHRVGARFATAVEVAEAAGFRPGRDSCDFWRV